MEKRISCKSVDFGKNPISNTQYPISNTNTLMVSMVSQPRWLAGQPRLRNHRNHLGCETIDVGIGIGIGYWILNIGFLPKSTLLQKNRFSNSHSPNFLKPKMLPPNCLTHYLSTISLFPSKKIDSKGICQKNPKSKNPNINNPYFPFKGGGPISGWGGTPSANAMISAAKPMGTMGFTLMIYIVAWIMGLVIRGK